VIDRKVKKRPLQAMHSGMVGIGVTGLEPVAIDISLRLKSEVLVNIKIMCLFE